MLRRTVVVLIILSILSILSINSLIAATDVKVEFIGKLKLPQDSRDSQKPLSIWNFTVSNDIIIAPCYKTSKIYLYEQVDKKMQWVNSIDLSPTGVKARPTRCYFSEETKQLFIYDHSKDKPKRNGKRIIIFKQKEDDKYQFIREKREIPINYSLYDFSLYEKKIYIAGYEEYKDIPYSFFSLDLEKNGSDGQPKKNFLLSSFDFYHIEPEYGFTFKESFGKKYVFAVGVRGFFDMQGDDIFCFWRGDLRILKFNSSGHSKRTSKTFNKKTSNYTRVFPNDELIDAYYRGDSVHIKNAYKKMSLVNEIFSDSERVIVVYQGPFNTQLNVSQLWLQVYTHDGIFVGETRIPGLTENLYYDQETRILYALSKSGNKDYFLLKYQLFDNK